MGYRDKKNPWHVLFDNFKKEYPTMVNDIKVFHPAEYPVIEIEYTTGDRILYNGTANTIRRIDTRNKSDFYRQLVYLLEL